MKAQRPDYGDLYRYQKRWRLDRNRGITRNVPAEPVRAHMARLAAAGIGMGVIHVETGLATSTLYNIASGRSRTCRRWVAEAILSVKTAVPAEGTAFVPARGARRRIQALLALGWTHEHMRAHSGITTAVVLHQCGDQVRANTHNAVDAMYEALCMTRGPSELTRQRSKRRGYRPPLAWDDIDRDPEPAAPDSDADLDPVVVQRILAGERIPASTAERYEVVRRWAGSLNELERLTGWNVYRLRREVA